MKRRANHHSCRKGKRVQFTMKNGLTFIDKFVEEQSKFLVFDKLGRVPREMVVSFKIYKGE